MTGNGGEMQVNTKREREGGTCQLGVEGMHFHVHQSGRLLKAVDVMLQNRQRYTTWLHHPPVTTHSLSPLLTSHQI
jgi:hypothetical protein